MKKYLGKITKAEYTIVKDYPFLMGLLLNFQFGEYGTFVGNGTEYCIRIKKDCNEEFLSELEKASYKITKDIYDILVSAKVHSVSELVGIPVEITMDGCFFVSFRILTEVL